MQMQQMQRSTASIRDERAVCSALQRLLGPDQELCDFTFIIGDQRERLRAVRAIVAVRSAPLRAMLFDDKFNNAKRELELPQWGAKAFRHMLEFLHTGVAEADAESVLELLQLADYFHIDELKNHCHTFLADNISADTVSTILAEATRFNDEEMRTKCKEFFLANARFILPSPSFNVLPAPLVCELLNDNALNSDEWGVYQAVKSWVASQPPHIQSQYLAKNRCLCDSCVEDEAAIVEAAAEPRPSSVMVGGSDPVACVRLSQLTVEQLHTVREDGLISEGALLDAALVKLDGRQPTNNRRRTFCFNFRFDEAGKGDGVALTEDRHVATFSKDNCVVGDKLLPDFGQAYFEVLVISGTNAYVGICRRERIDVQRNMGSGGGIAFRGIGGNEIWRECAHFEYGRRLSKGDRVGVLVDLPAHSVTFYMNGESLGVAFDNLDPTKRYWPCISNNGGEIRLVPNPRLPP